MWTQIRLADGRMTDLITPGSLFSCAVERLADKLSMAARDKLAQASLERQLQAQRKRRAAAFLNSLRQTDPGSPASDLAPNAVATGC